MRCGAERRSWTRKIKCRSRSRCLIRRRRGSAQWRDTRCPLSAPDDEQHLFRAVRALWLPQPNEGRSDPTRPIRPQTTNSAGGPRRGRATPYHHC